MNWQAVNFDWNQARAFWATAEQGSFSAASRVLRQSQPTLGRQVAALEDHLGVTLFERVGRTLVLTEAGQSLLEHVRSMGDAASRLSLSATGQSQQLEGHVSVTATDIMSTHYLPEMLRSLRQAAPGITVTVVATNSIQDLMRRDADIAIRHVRPTEPELIARRVGDMTGHLYASRDFLQRANWPETAQEIAQCDFVGYDDHERMVEILQGQGIPVTRDNIKYSSANGVAAWAMIEAGLGVGPMSQDASRIVKDVIKVLPEFSVPIPIWLIAHRELRTSRRIRLVYDHLAEAFGRAMQEGHS